MGCPGPLEPWSDSLEFTDQALGHLFFPAVVEVKQYRIGAAGPHEHHFGKSHGKALSVILRICGVVKESQFANQRRDERKNMREH